MKRSRATRFSLLLIFAIIMISIYAPFLRQVTASGQMVNEFTLHLSSEVRQQPLDPYDSIFGVCYLPPDPSRTTPRGLAWRRLDCLWSRIHPDNDTWDWSEYDRDVEQSVASNIYQIVLLCYGNPNITGADYFHIPPDKLDAWGDFVRQIVRRYRGNKTIIAYEVWNEANGDGFWKGSAEDYARLLIKTSGIIRQEDPNALILCTGTQSSVNAKLGPNEDFYSRLFDWNESHPEFKGKIIFDVYNIHAYLNNPVEYRELIRRQKSVCEKYNFDWRPHPGSLRFQDRFSKIWCTEIGFGGNRSSQADLNRQQQKTIKAATIGYFENIGRHLIYQWKWDETWTIEGKPVEDAMATIFPIWKNSTPFESFSHINDYIFKANNFNLYAAKTHDNRLAISFWDEQTPGTVFKILVNASIQGVQRILLPNFSWSYMDHVSHEGSGLTTVARIKNNIVSQDFQMLLVNTTSAVETITIILKPTIGIVSIYILMPVLFVFSAVSIFTSITVGFLRRRKVRGSGSNKSAG
ncbi:MAG: cellulase family glycosylhydrolase [Promethearchaeota archaeon]